MSKFAVIVFPGSNCDHDCEHVIGTILGQPVKMIWHTARSLEGADAVILPGGFTYGDYLRTGAIARFAPIMPAVIAHAEKGGPVLGICNGFQILTESGLLPGALVRNTSLKFACHAVHLKVENTNTVFTGSCFPGQVLRMPIAHGEGRYTADPGTIAMLERTGRVIFRYCAASGEASPEANPNGSINHIAGISNEGGNIVGLMPHPERASEEVFDSVDGRIMFESAIDFLARKAGGKASLRALA